MLTLALVVFISAIIVAFSKELGEFINRLFAIRGFKLLIPLTVISLITVDYEIWIFEMLWYLHTVLHKSIDFLANLLPFKLGAKAIVSIVFFMLLTLIPAYISLFVRKNKYEEDHFAFWSLVIWLFLGIIFSVS